MPGNFPELTRSLVKSLFCIKLTIPTKWKAQNRVDRLMNTMRRVKFSWVVYTDTTSASGREPFREPLWRVHFRPAYPGIREPPTRASIPGRVASRYPRCSPPCASYWPKFDISFLVPILSQVVWPLEPRILCVGPFPSCIDRRPSRLVRQRSNLSRFQGFHSRQGGDSNAIQSRRDPRQFASRFRLLGRLLSQE